MKPRNRMFLYEVPGGAGAGTAVVPPPAAAPPAEPPVDERTVPLAQLQKERKLRQEADDKLAAFERDRETARVAELGEVERVKLELATAAAERDTLKAQATLRGKGDLIRGAAVKDFADPEDAVALLQARPGFDEITTAAEAIAAVKALATEKPHLLRVAGGPNLAVPGIEKVLGDGLVVPAVVPAGVLADDGRTLSHAELRGLSSAQMEDLRVNHPKTYERSFKALKK